jgi:hypothetical protein
MPVRTQHSRLASRTLIATERMTIAVGTSEARRQIRFGGAKGPGPLLADSRRRTLGRSFRIRGAVVPRTAP